MGKDEVRKHKKRAAIDVYVLIALTLISFLLLFFSTRSFILNFKDAGLSIFSGIRGGIYEVTSFVSRTVLSIQELAVLRTEYADLRDQVARYEQMERSTAEIRQENRRLREQLGFAETLQVKRIAAEIIAHDPDNLFAAFAINKGRHSGVSTNMPVIAFQNGVQGVIGKVITAGEFESLVMPVYGTSSFIAARLSESRYEGIVEGQGPDSPLLMRFVRKSARADINPGDVIITSGLGGIYPPNVTIGRVSHILDRTYEISIDIELESVIDFSRLEYVFVIDIKPEPEQQQ
jgi:rod shape-determining protein MreC